jgi:hypothetical protein
VTGYDGARRIEDVIVIVVLRVGSHVLRNVMATAAPIGSPALLGLTELNHAGKIAIDTGNRR